ncbi:NlpC/P60 family protein [Bacillus sp. V5-8f]|uniref:C40 family peptidase n=1 Tax=Bacillus sp. V5-8f TaxID=2053044 RepID=UPI000C783662|nr:C40 family peptidase [Bacillus sp. V5-8f]PLT34530.1 peptidase [Bacillus sp. V5-8f]
MRKKLLALNTAIMLGAGSLFATGVQAESLKQQEKTLQGQRSQVQSDIAAEVDKVESLQAEQKKLAEQIKRIEQAIKDNVSKIDEAKVQIADTNQEIEKLKKEIAELQERMEKRNQVLKQRAVSFQESGGEVNYLEVLLSSTDFSNFIERVGAVATLVKADQEILKQQEADKKELEQKQSSVENKLSKLTAMKTELEGMLAGIKEQQSQSLALNEQLQKKEIETASFIAQLKKKDAKLAEKVTLVQLEMKKEQERLAKIAEAKQRAAEEAKKKAQLAASSKAKEQQAIAKTESKPERKTEVAEQKSTKQASNKVETTQSKPSQQKPAEKPVRTGVNRSIAITAGNKYIGNSVYVFGGGRTQSDIDNGRFDCSAFVHWAYSQAGVELGQRGWVSTESLKNAGRQVPASQMQPGDLVFFDTYKKDGHVGIYVGGGQFIGSQSSTGVAIANMKGGYWGKVFNGRVVRI